MKFTNEEMIVVSVWYHERRYTNLSLVALEKHFLDRFGKEAPKKNSILRWEKRLFSSNIISKRDDKRTFNNNNISHVQKVRRTAFIPYILDSLELYPDLTISKRSKLLGLNVTTLTKILTTDMKDLQEFLPKKRKGEAPKNSSEQDQNQESQKKVNGD